jgi:aspartyl-tRNA(Asn)/glutamyl-tRNA(Gln) amidotransferase subunit B
VEQYGLSFDEAAQLTDSREMADYFEKAASASGNGKAAANWMLNDLAREIKATSGDISNVPVSAESLAEMIKMIDSGEISGKMAKDVLVKMYQSGKSAEEVVRELGGSQVTDEAQIRAFVDQAIAANPKQLEQYRAGKTSLAGFFVGQVMKLSGGRANPQVVNEVLKRALEDKGMKAE